MPKCKSCAATIKWIKTKEGKNHPIDKSPEMRWVAAHMYDSTGWALMPTYKSHFATCPDADKHRKPKT